MKELSLPTKVYLAAIYCGGGGLFISYLHFAIISDPMMVIALSLLASFFHIYKVVGATDRSHYTFSFLIYGFTFAHFGIAEVLVVILISNIAEWIWNRPPWFIQVFNISCYFIAASGAFLVFGLINPSGSLTTPLGVLSIVISMGAFTLLNHFILGIVLWLARGENFKVSRMLDVFPFVMDTTLLMFGCILNVVWNTSPYTLILFLFPLYLIYSTLRIPALERKTEIDQKTGLFNHSYFIQHLAKELDRANRFDRPLSVIMLDLDLLRNINNTYGHLAGDEVLIGVARILKQSVREYDAVARFGGEEFVIMLPETTIQQSFERAEIIRRAIEGTEFAIPTSVTPIKATISLGLAERESFAQTVEEIIHNADTALYHSKLNGRNKSSAYTNDAYVNLLVDEQKVRSLPKDQMNNELHQKSATGTAADYPAAKTKYIKAQTVSKAPGISATNEKSSKTLPRKFTSRFQPVYFFIGGLAALAISLFYGLYRYAPEIYQINWTQIWPGLLTCIVFVVLTELYSIDLYLGKTSLSTSAVPLLAGSLLYGPIAGVILSTTYAVIVGIKYRSKFNKYIFNFSNQVIAVMFYTIALHLTGRPIYDFSIVIQALLVVMAALIVYITNTALISIGMGIDLRQSPNQIWKEQYAWLVTIYVGIGLIATAYIFGYHQEGVLGALLMMVPLLLLRISQKQYVDRTREAVTELREKNIILEKSAEEINHLNDGLLDTLAEIIDLRDPYVFGHSKRVTNYATMIAEKMGLNPKQVELIRKGSLLHDLGKLGISMDILAKPGPLSDLEYKKIKDHPEIGARVLGMNPSLRLLIPIVRHHHEFYNGQGYPDGLSGYQIPIEARIVSVADAIEAMASDRPYRKARSRQYILNEIKRFSGSQFDPKVAEQAVRLLESEEINQASFAPVGTIFAIRGTGNQLT
jgi:diguanylate cyclase (GGDEF)-like protein/putative nucleotidyltransferase with HDIG domain